VCLKTAVCKIIVNTSSSSEALRCSIRNLNVGHISLFRWRECEEPVHLKREIGTYLNCGFLIKRYCVKQSGNQ